MEAGIDGVQPGRGASLSKPLDAQREKPVAPQGRHVHAEFSSAANPEILLVVSSKQDYPVAQSDAYRNRTLASQPLESLRGCFVEPDWTGNTH